LSKTAPRTSSPDRVGPVFETLESVPSLNPASAFWQGG
jgi:hypothetical protein